MAPAGHQATGLPHAGGDQLLDPLAGQRVGAHQHFLAAAVRVQQVQDERIAPVDMPDLVPRQPVKAGHAARTFGIQADHGSAGGRAGVIHAA